MLGVHRALSKLQKTDFYFSVDILLTGGQTENQTMMHLTKSRWDKTVKTNLNVNICGNLEWDWLTNWFKGSFIIVII